MIARVWPGVALLLVLTGCGDAGSNGAPSAQRNSAVEPAPTVAAPVTPSPTASSPPVATLADSDCGADKLASFVNLLPTSTAKADIAAAAGTRESRYIEPGQAVTDDFVPTRLNAEIGFDGRIKRFYCG